MSGGKTTTRGERRVKCVHSHYVCEFMFVSAGLCARMCVCVCVCDSEYRACVCVSVHPRVCVCATGSLAVYNIYCVREGFVGGRIRSKLMGERMT